MMAKDVQLLEKDRKSIFIFWLWCCRHARATNRETTYSTVRTQTAETSRKISPSIEKCFMLKERILKLARKKKIDLDINEVS